MPKAENCSVGISQSVSLALRGEGHQAEKGIDSAELFLKRVLFIVCQEDISPSARPAVYVNAIYETHSINSAAFCLRCL